MGPRWLEKSGRALRRERPRTGLRIPSSPTTTGTFRGSAQLTYAGRVALGLDVNESTSTGDVRKEQAT